MKTIRWWNSFNLLGITLIVFAIIGFIAGDKFVFDPGRPLSQAPIYYLVAGVLMIVNGLLQPSHSTSKDN